VSATALRIPEPLPPQGAPARPTPEQLLAKFGLDAFRPGQREAVQAALDGRDSLVVMPTGAGKSLCYQLPALVGDSDPTHPLVLVVSPLIALMDDQRSRLLAAGVRAAMLASTAEPSQNAAELARIVNGQAQIALVAPERFASRGFREAISQRRVSLFVVDEAHCVAEWGHDFRPDYLRLHGAIEALGRPTVMASTATATPRVAAEIASRLGLRDWVSISGGFDRPNIAFDVVTVEGKGALARKRAALAHMLADPQARPAIVYCGTRKDTDALAAEIAGWGLSVVAYHAGMAAQARRRAQESFMGGQVEVIVATNAFGMGVDKADVRTVAHWALPTSLEGYYQEAGRGGRDGEPARALLLAARMDLGRLIRFNTERNITVAEVRGFVGRLRAGADDGTARIERGELDDRGRSLLSIAERAGAAVLEPGAGGGLLVELTGRGSPRAAHLAIRAAQDRGWEAYRAIERFVANAEVCRRRQLLAHFGDGQRVPALGRCCDVCDPDPQLARAIELAPAARSRGRAGAARPGESIPGVAKGAATPAADAEPVDEQQFERLRQWRVARAEGKPAYTVATNAVLEEVLRRRPAAEAELLAIKGVGPAFCAKHGDSLLDELARM
jgi:RecQ family ATP-dependent DNA helicase